MSSARELDLERGAPAPVHAAALPASARERPTFELPATGTAVAAVSLGTTASITHAVVADTWNRAAGARLRALAARSDAIEQQLVARSLCAESAAHRQATSGATVTSATAPRGRAEPSAP